MNLINGTIYKWYNNNVILSGASIEINDNEIYIVEGKNKEQVQTLLEVLGLVDDNKLKTLNYNIKSNEIVYIPSNLICYKYMKVSDLVRFYTNTHNNFNNKKAHDLLKCFKINIKERIIKLDDTSKVLLRLIVGFSLNAKLYVINGLLTNQRELNEKIKRLVEQENEKTFIIYDDNNLIKDISTKTIYIKDYDKIEIKGESK